MIWNVGANVAGTIVNMISGLLVMPYLILKLGTATYGLWILIGTLSGYFGVLDLGVSAALGRLLAFHRARQESAQMNAVMSTAFALLMIAFLIVCIATFLALLIFPHIFRIPAEHALDARVSIILVGLSLALTFPASVFGGLLWGFERFDLQNAVDIPALILRTVLSMTMVSVTAPLTSLGIIVLVVNGCSIVLKLVICRRLAPELRLSARHVERSKIRQIFSIGGWMSVISWSRTLIPQIAPTLIGVRLGSATVTTFTVARQLVAYVNIFTNSATQVMTPRAIAAHATNSVDIQERLFIEGGKFAYALTVFICGGFICLGLPFIHWWQHGLQDASYPLLLVLLLGETLPMSQWLTYSVLQGAGRQKQLGLLAILEALLSLPLILGLIGPEGVRGVCVGVALAGFLVRGFAQWLYGCRLLNIRVSAYARRVFIPVTLAGTFPVLALYVSTLSLKPDSFSSIFLLGIGYGIVFATTVSLDLIGYSRLKALAISSLQPQQPR
jgi:O-antigen/teichoic acid export membrane protein